MFKTSTLGPFQLTKLPISGLLLLEMRDGRRGEIVLSPAQLLDLRDICAGVYAALKADKAEGAELNLNL